MSLIELPPDDSGPQSSRTAASTPVAEAVADPPLLLAVSVGSTGAATSSSLTASPPEAASDALPSPPPVSVTQSDDLPLSSMASSLHTTAPAPAPSSQSSSSPSSALASLSELLNALPASPPLPPSAATGSSPAGSASSSSSFSLAAPDESWQLSLSSLTEELNAMDEETQREALALLQSRMQRNAELIAADESGIGALPHADAASRGWYTVVMDAYLKLRRGSRRTEGEGRRDFMRRKVRAREARKQRKAEDAFDRQQHRMQTGRRRATSRRRAAY